ncbi:TonB-dependent receptor domain-containing protein [Parasphingorhabdus sp.]|uniref:TonB-dependent receptor domain-containing protein n=1 Tax=Parasphingorhabdus sp. TaxID=2709688 RepID=UPI00300262C4
MRKYSNLKASVAPMVLGLAMVSTPAFAQDQEAAEASESVIIVTGSRISNPNLVQSAPVNVVGEDEIDLRQASNAEELIGELPGVSPGVNGSVNNGSAGFATLNLRNLGSRRNLVLLDGTRLVPSSLSSQTDLNIIPVALVERVDIVTGGASSVYGADAIAGVANFVTKRDFAGVDMGFSMGLAEEGDGQRFRTDVTIGANFDDGRGNAVLSVGYQTVDSVLQSDRAISQDALFIEGSKIGSGTSTPTRITSDRDTFANPTSNGMGGFDANPNNPLAAADQRADRTANQNSFANDVFVPTFNTFNFAPFNYFQTPLERFNVFGKARYEVTDNIEVYTKAMFTKSTVSLQLAPSGLFGDTWQFPLNNPFINDAQRQQICAGQGFVQEPNPNYVDEATTPGVPPTRDSGVRNVDAATCTAAGAATNPGDADYLEVPVTINRRLVEQGNRQTDYVTNQFQIWGGVRGSVTETIDFDVYGSYGQSDRTQTNRNWGLKSRVQQALRANDANTCSDTSNGCVPINLFGPQVGTNEGRNISAESVAFFNQPSGQTVKTSLAVVNASLSGDLGTESFLFADTPIGFAVGAEYRKYTAEQASDVASGTQDEVLGTGAPSPSYQGEYDVKEVFGELIIPIAENIPGIYNLTVEAGVRYSDYSNSGGSTTWKAGGTWEPVEGYKIRGIYQHAVRSPNIGELFAPVVTGLTALAVDPCAGAGGIGLSAICIAQGAPAASIGSIPVPSASQINATSGGNPNLGPETANSYTIGVVLTPPSVPGLSITADYYNIKVTGAITTPTPGDILDPCFVDRDPTACALIVRNPLNGSLNGGGDTPGLLLQLTNQGTIETSGVDLRVAYQLPTSFGKVAFDFGGNWTRELKFQSSPASINRECVSFYGENCEPITPELTFNARTTVSLDDTVDISLLWTWMDGVSLEPLSASFGGALPEYSSISAYSYFDLTTRFSVTDNFELTAGVQNLLDKKPPNVSSFVGSSSYNSGNTYPTTYDAIGRRYQVTGRLRF